MPVITECPICKKEVKAGFTGFPRGARYYHRIDSKTHDWWEVDEQIFLNEEDAVMYLHSTYPERFDDDWVKYMLGERKGGTKRKKRCAVAKAVTKDIIKKECATEDDRCKIVKEITDAMIEKECVQKEETWQGYEHLSWEKTIDGKKYDLEQNCITEEQAKGIAHSEEASGYKECEVVKGYVTLPGKITEYKIYYGVYCRTLSGLSDEEQVRYIEEKWKKEREVANP